MPFITANLINQAYYQNEFKLFVVYAPLGYGKSAFAIKVLAEVLGDLNRVKDFLVFHPKDFVERCLSMGDKREKAIIWDDAGVWLFYMKYADPFVQAVVRYMNVARTNWGAMILTTPSPSMVTHKMRYFPQNICVKITKEGGFRNKDKPRLATGYRSWIAPDFRHQGVRKLYVDKFSAMLPNSFYWDYYLPLRNSYAIESQRLMKGELKNLKGEAKELSAMAEVV